VNYINTRVGEYIHWEEIDRLNIFFASHLLSFNISNGISLEVDVERSLAHFKVLKQTFFSNFELVV